MIEAQELAKKLGPNFKQNRIQTMVDQWMTWKANEVLHGGNVHRLMRQCFEIATDGLLDSPPEPRKVPVYLYRRRDGCEFASIYDPPSYQASKHLATAEFVIPQEKESL